LFLAVEPANPATLATVGIILIVVAAVACHIPACRAALVDPLVALKAK
jgi:ABC-type lipoprotein release transport system permease subunit